MEKPVYVVRSFINGHEGIRPTEFHTKEDAMEFIDILYRHATREGVKVEYYLYEAKEIYCAKN